MVTNKCLGLHFVHFLGQVLFPLTLIKCLKGHNSVGVLYGTVFQKCRLVSQ